MTGGQPHSDFVLSMDLWCLLFNQAHLLAAKYVSRLRWRGTFGGVLPDGYDAESIASQAVLDFLQSASDRSFQTPNCELQTSLSSHLRPLTSAPSEGQRSSGPLSPGP